MRNFALRLLTAALLSGIAPATFVNLANAQTAKGSAETRQDNKADRQEDRKDTRTENKEDRQEDRKDTRTENKEQRQDRREDRKEAH